MRININHIIFSVFESSMEEIEFFLDDISKDMLENKTTKKGDALQNLICFDKNEQTILLNNYKKEAYNAIFFLSSQSPKYVCMISSVSDGWITLFNVLSSKIKKSCFHFEIDGTASPMNMMIFSHGEIERVIYSLKDTRWIFYEKGDVLPFENKNYYQKRKISARLNKSILIEYCKHLGFDITEVSFWQSPVSALFYCYSF